MENPLRTPFEPNVTEHPEPEEVEPSDSVETKIQKYSAIYTDADNLIKALEKSGSLTTGWNERHLTKQKARRQNALEELQKLRNPEDIQPPTHH